MADRLFQRVDFEIVALGLSAGATAGLYYRDVLTGAMVVTGTVATVYGVRIIGQALPLPSVGELGGAVAGFATSVQAIPAFIPRMPLSRGPVAVEDTSREQAWRDVLARFLLAANLRRSFALRELGPRGGGYVSDYAWRILARVLQANGIVAGGRAGLDYAPGWEKRRALFTVRYEPLALPVGLPPRVTI